MKRLISLVAACAIAACSNSATTLPPSAGVQVSNASASHRAKGALVLRIHVPRHRHHRHGARYVSPATRSMTVAIAGPTPINQTVGLTPTSTGCSSSLTGTFCTLTTPGLLPGSYTATMTMYDGTGGTGNVLSAAQSVAFTILSGVDNTIGITLSGVPVATIVTPANANVLGNSYGIFDLVGSGPYKFLARTLDADGNIIAGPGAPTFTIGTPSGSLAGVTRSPASTTTTAPNTFTVMPPSTYAAGTAQFTVTPTFSGQPTDGCAQTGANCGGATVIVAMGLPFSWTQLSPVTSPPARSGAMMAYDPATSQLILFGGAAGGGQLNDTWDWNGTNWTQLSPVSSPAARGFATMAYDTATSQLILFGGASSSGNFNDTWNWDGTNWVLLSPATSPPARNGAAMVSDAFHGSIVLFGGAGNSNALNDTWTWDGTNWVQRFPSTSPPARSNAAMAYDAGSGTVVLFGGRSGVSSLNDTWTWDGNNWTQQNPANSPSVRRAPSMVYDPTRGAAILFGGFDAGSLFNDTWMWNRTTWTQLAPASSPAARRLSAMDFDPNTGTLVLFGGAGNSGNLGDTWKGL